MGDISALATALSTIRLHAFAKAPRQGTFWFPTMFTCHRPRSWPAKNPDDPTNRCHDHLRGISFENGFWQQIYETHRHSFSHVPRTDQEHRGSHSVLLNSK